MGDMGDIGLIVGATLCCSAAATKSNFGGRIELSFFAVSFFAVSFFAVSFFAEVGFAKVGFAEVSFADEVGSAEVGFADEVGFAEWNTDIQQQQQQPQQQLNIELGTGQPESSGGYHTGSDDSSDHGYGQGGGAMGLGTFPNTQRLLNRDICEDDTVWTCREVMPQCVLDEYTGSFRSKSTATFSGPQKDTSLSRDHTTHLLVQQKSYGLPSPSD
ncbi:hypothetical protein MAR_015402 [Mya arenaria]|uniref:Uncharacterized protein n=1 Tax=Mya arenaria TaxID=6604 RepID=A0ABY7FL78_MYAAR|nr:hypothetical protein MAR_015402 [Mya arenaria]